MTRSSGCAITARGKRRSFSGLCYVALIAPYLELVGGRSCPKGSCFRPESARRTPEAVPLRYEESEMAKCEKPGWAREVPEAGDYCSLHGSKVQRQHTARKTRKSKRVRPRS